MDAIGGNATIYAGFVWYNVITYPTDIEPMKNWDPKLGLLFLIVNDIGFASGIASVLIATYLGVVAGKLKNIQRQVFALRAGIIGDIALGLAVVSLFCFFLGFAAYGFVKYQPRRYIPAFFAFLCFMLCLGMGAYVVFSRSWAVAEEEKELQRRGDTRLPKYDEKKVSGRPDRLKAQTQKYSTQALFFGAFCYFAATFFGASERPFAEPYVLAISASFGTACTAVVVNTILLVQEAYLTSDLQREKYWGHVEPIANYSSMFFFAATAFFFWALAFIGLIKTNKGWEDWWEIMMVAGVSGFIGMIVLWYIFLQTKMQITCIGDLPTTVEKMGEVGYPEANPDLFVQIIDAASMQASFCAGNVFFEILFSDFGSPVYTAFYFILSCATMVMGCWVVIIATLTSASLTSFENDEQRKMFAAKMHRWPDIVFGLTLASQISWVLSVIAGGETKYPEWRAIFGRNVPVAGGILALIMILALWFWVRRVYKRCWDEGVVKAKERMARGPQTEMTEIQPRKDVETTEEPKEEIPMSSGMETAQIADAL
eukprot:TRINITY_DN56872_c0_g2_i1.p1 TRINITY_DN56872_c0_g2~~TRINITY_DN56872_c0_g2_i1.p1  ORF type:complete len:572 (-),score=52.40 TRINITY_DN56872_c0_g2_i1:139-1761(-)